MCQSNDEIVLDFIECLKDPQAHKDSFIHKALLHTGDFRISKEYAEQYMLSIAEDLLDLDKDLSRLDLTKRLWLGHRLKEVVEVSKLKEDSKVKNAKIRKALDLSEKVNQTDINQDLIDKLKKLYKNLIKSGIKKEDAKYAIAAFTCNPMYQGHPVSKSKLEDMDVFKE